MQRAVRSGPDPPLPATSCCAYAACKAMRRKLLASTDLRVKYCGFAVGGAWVSERDAEGKSGTCSAAPSQRWRIVWSRAWLPLEVLALSTRCCCGVCISMTAAGVVGTGTPRRVAAISAPISRPIVRPIERGVVVGSRVARRVAASSAPISRPIERIKSTEAEPDGVRTEYEAE